MTIYLRLILIIISLLTGYYVLRKIRKSQLQIEDSLFWILFSFFLIFLSVFPVIAIKLSNLIGIESPANFIFLLIIFILLIKVFSMSIKMSQIEHKLRTLTQNYAIHESKSTNMNTEE
jgi:hypothetical protein